MYQCLIRDFLKRLQVFPYKNQEKRFLTDLESAIGCRVFVNMRDSEQEKFVARMINAAIQDLYAYKEDPSEGWERYSKMAEIAVYIKTCCT